MEKKKILITGKGSYVGTNFIEWLKQWPNQYEVDEISVRGDEWKNKDFSKYDSVLHVAGIAHVSKNPNMEKQYYKINSDLTSEVATHAKKHGVKQFIFMSSIIVYGENRNEKGMIDEYTVPLPRDYYGNSKLQAEKKIKKLESIDFSVATIRPPMIYGKNSKGNYPKFSKLVKILPVFPEYENIRSMIHIDNLSEFIRVLINIEGDGLFFPQNKEYVKSIELAKAIAKVNGKKICSCRTFNIIIENMIGKNNLITKVFGDLIYDKRLSEIGYEYRVRDFTQSIKLTELEVNNIEDSHN